MLQNIHRLENLDAQHNQLHQTIGQLSWELLPEVATDSSTITRDTLPPNSAQFYINGTDRNTFYNLNNSIYSTKLILKGEKDLPKGLALTGQSSGDITYFDGTNWVVLPSSASTNYLKGGAAPNWAAIDTSGFSNVVFSFSGCAGANFIAGGQAAAVAHWNVTGTTYTTVIATKFKKMSSIDTVTFYAYMASGASDKSAYINVDIGGQAAAINTTANHNTIQWLTNDVDVSGLTDGTFYDVVIQLKNADTPSTNLYSLIGIAS